MRAMRSLLLCFLLLASGAASTAEPIVFAYFVQWGVYQRRYFVKDIDARGAAARIDVLTYAFAKVGDDNRVALVDTHADHGLFHTAETSVDGVPDSWDAGALRGNFNQLRKLKARHPHLRVVVSIGGWTFSDRFSAMAAARRASTPATLIRNSLVPRLSSIGRQAAEQAAANLSRAAASTLVPISALAASGTNST